MESNRGLDQDIEPAAVEGDGALADAVADDPPAGERPPASASGAASAGSAPAPPP